LFFTRSKNPKNVFLTPTKFSIRIRIVKNRKHSGWCISTNTQGLFRCQYMLTYLKCLKSHFCFKEKHYKDQRTELFKRKINSYKIMKKFTLIDFCLTSQLYFHISAISMNKFSTENQ
jgi:hypothetical protein